MPTSVTIVHTGPDGVQRCLQVAFSETSTGMKRCLGTAAAMPGAEADLQFRLRLLGAALIEALQQAPVREPGLTERAVDRAEEAVMLAVKALYEGKAAG